jgi:CTP:molybdopterin cytidylyltransferase MocA
MCRSRILDVERSPDHDAPRSHGVGVLLAGGEGRRFAGPRHKLLTVVGGRSLFEWGLAAIRSAGLEPWIVWGALAEDPPPTPPDVVVLLNARWREGMATSVWAAIDRARGLGLDALTLGPADQPGITASAWRAVSAAPARIAVATYGGRRGNPVKLTRPVWDDVPHTGDVGGRAVMELHPDQVVEVACQGNPADIDTLEDLDRWNSSTTSP